MPPSPNECEEYDDVDDNNNNSNNSNINPYPISNSPSTNQLQQDSSHTQQQDSCTPTNSSETSYTRNRSTTRSWPVIYRNNSLPSQHNNFLEPNQANYTKTEQLQTRSELKRKSTHQYDFDQIFGLNNANYQQYLASHRKSSNFECGYDKSPSIYDMQHHNQESPEQTQTSGFCNTPPTVIFLLITLIMTTSATSMLCAAFLTGNKRGRERENRKKKLLHT